MLQIIELSKASVQKTGAVSTGSAMALVYCILQRVKLNSLLPLADSSSQVDAYKYRECQFYCGDL